MSNYNNNTNFYRKCVRIASTSETNEGVLVHLVNSIAKSLAAIADYCDEKVKAEYKDDDEDDDDAP